MGSDKGLSFTLSVFRVLSEILIACPEDSDVADRSPPSILTESCGKSHIYLIPLMVSKCILTLSNITSNMHLSLVEFAMRTILDGVKQI